ncbi:hypothetical protein HDV05_003515 [Chytridiales sp. JEL 0842]|nr:hypothetical protein HDV05_003515 [Chytridiales sp. JEL 0842]
MEDTNDGYTTSIPYSTHLPTAESTHASNSVAESPITRDAPPSPSLTTSSPAPQPPTSLFGSLYRQGTQFIRGLLGLPSSSLPPAASSNGLEDRLGDPSSAGALETEEEASNAETPVAAAAPPPPPPLLNPNPHRPGPTVTLSFILERNNPGAPEPSEEEAMEMMQRITHILAEHTVNPETDLTTILPNEAPQPMVLDEDRFRETPEREMSELMEGSGESEEEEEEEVEEEDVDVGGGFTYGFLRDLLGRPSRIPLPRRRGAMVSQSELGEVEEAIVEEEESRRDYSGLMPFRRRQQQREQRRRGAQFRLVTEVYANTDEQPHQHGQPRVEGGDIAAAAENEEQPTGVVGPRPPRPPQHIYTRRDEITLENLPATLARLLQGVADAARAAGLHDMMHLQGQPPASSEALSQLKKIKLPFSARMKRRFGSLSCTVCMESFCDNVSSQESEEVNGDCEEEEGLMMPCHHIYHKKCLTLWLKTSNTCPMCRFELKTDNPEYNIGVEQRMAARLGDTCPVVMDSDEEGEDEYRKVGTLKRKRSSVEESSLDGDVDNPESGSRHKRTRGTQ